MASKRRFGRTGEAIFVACFVLLVAAPTNGQATVLAPVKVTARDTVGMREITTDPFGNVYAASGDAPTRLFKFAPDLTPIYDRPVTTGDPTVATDSAGRVLVAGDAGFERYSAAGGALGSYDRAGIGVVGGIASDATDHFYVPERDQSGAGILSEYRFVNGVPTATGSTPYVDTPDDGFTLGTFFDTAVDAERDVYVSGVAQSPEARFIHRYGPDLAGSPFTIKSCPAAPACGWASALDVARLATSTGPEDFLIADNYLNADVQVYSTGPSGSAAGTFPLDFTPGSLSVTVDFASSDCTDSLYVLFSVFDNPGNTYSGSRIQRYDTGAASGPCPTPPLVTLTGLGKAKYKLRPQLGASGPCIQCGVLGADGKETLGPAARPSSREPLAKHKGLKLRFDAAVAGDVRFVVRGPTEARGKPPRRGGFLFPADAGANTFTFTGVLQAGKALRAGTYKTTVTDTAGTKLEAFRVEVLDPARR